MQKDGVSRQKLSVAKNLIDWFEVEGEDYPWRQTQDPWEILISEVMLQQTTITSVIKNRRFEKFLKQFPSLEAISSASEESLLKAWEGLGYYNRVRNLQKTAVAVLEDWEGKFPNNIDDLQKLPGIGPYTAAAIASFAFDIPAALVDGNVARILTRIFDQELPIDSSEGKKWLWETAEILVDQKKPRIYNSALMELGQKVCRPKNPLCLTCPIQTSCDTQLPNELPRKKKKIALSPRKEFALWSRRGSQLLLAKESGTRRKGFYRLPLRSEEEAADLELLSESRYTITRYRVTLQVYRETAKASSRSEEEWIPISELDDLPLISPVRKILPKLLAIDKL